MFHMFFPFILCWTQLLSSLVKKLLSILDYYLLLAELVCNNLRKISMITSSTNIVCFVSHLQSMLSLVTLTVLLMVLSTVICTVIFFSSTPMLVLKYDHCRISTGVLICLYSGHLTSSTKIEVLLCFHVTHSRMHSHIYDQFFI